MNTISKILLGAVVIAVFACLWYVLTQKNHSSSGCCGNCSGCSQGSCTNRKENSQNQ